MRLRSGFSIEDRELVLPAICYIINGITKVKIGLSKKYLILDSELLNDGCTGLKLECRKNPKISNTSINVYYDTTNDFAVLLDSILNENELYDDNLLQVILSYLNKYCNIDVFYQTYVKLKKRKRYF